MPSASALAFDDNVRPFARERSSRSARKARPGRPYSTQLAGSQRHRLRSLCEFQSSSARCRPGSQPVVERLDQRNADSRRRAGRSGSRCSDIPASDGGISWCSDNKSTEEQFTITVLQGLKIIQARACSAPGAGEHAPYSFQFTATGGSRDVVGLFRLAPAGFTLSARTASSAGTPDGDRRLHFKITGDRRRPLRHRRRTRCS